MIAVLVFHIPGISAGWFLCECISKRHSSLLVQTQAQTQTAHAHNKHKAYGERERDRESEGKKKLFNEIR